MHSFVTSTNVKLCCLIGPTLYVSVCITLYIICTVSQSAMSCHSTVVQSSHNLVTTATVTTSYSMRSSHSKLFWFSGSFAVAAPTI